MAKAKAGDVLSCEVCGLTVIIDEECGCATVDIICCEEPMTNTGLTSTRRAQPVEVPKKKAVAKKVKAVKKEKPVVKKKTVMKVAKKVEKKPVKKIVKKTAKKK